MLLLSINSLFFIIILVFESSYLSYCMLLLCFFVSACIAQSFCYSESRIDSLSSCLSHLLLVTVSVFFTSSSLLFLYISFELSLLPVLLLILLLGYQPEKIISSLYLLVYTIICSFPLFINIVLSPDSSILGIEGLGSVGTALVSLAFLAKSPLYSLHAWLPKAHVEAPLVGSMLLSGVILKLGGYGLLLIRPNPSFFFSAVLYLSVFGGLLCSLLCFASWDVKSVVAYSSIIHIGVVTMGVLSGTESGYWVATASILSHSLVSPLLFRLANILYLSFSSRSFIVHHSFSGPCFLLFLICSFLGLNFGLPPSINFWVEVSLFSIYGQVWLGGVLVLVCISFFSFMFSIILYIRSCGGKFGPAVVSCFSVYEFLPGLFFSYLSSISGSLFSVC